MGPISSGRYPFAEPGQGGTQLMRTPLEFAGSAYGCMAVGTRYPLAVEGASGPVVPDLGPTSDVWEGRAGGQLIRAIPAGYTEHHEPAVSTAWNISRRANRSSVSRTCVSIDVYSAHKYHASNVYGSEPSKSQTARSGQCAHAMYSPG